MASRDYLSQEVGDNASFSPSRAVLVAERCPGCGAVEFAFTKYPLGGRPLHNLATVNLTGQTDHQVVIGVNLPRGQLERDGERLLVLVRVSGQPRLSRVGFTN